MLRARGTKRKKSQALHSRSPRTRSWPPQAIHSMWASVASSVHEEDVKVSFPSCTVVLSHMQKEFAHKQTPGRGKWESNIFKQSRSTEVILCKREWICQLSFAIPVFIYGKMFKEFKTVKPPGSYENVDSDSLGLGWGLECCISHQPQERPRLLVPGHRLE